MTVEEIMDLARNQNERARKRQAEAAEEERKTYADELERMLPPGTWAVLGVDPEKAKITRHVHPNSYLSLGRVLEARGRVKTDDWSVSLVVRCPLQKAFRAEVHVNVSGRHDVKTTLWPVPDTPPPPQPDLEDVAESQRRANTLAIGRMLLDYEKHPSRRAS